MVHRAPNVFVSLLAVCVLSVVTLAKQRGQAVAPLCRQATGAQETSTECWLAFGAASRCRRSGRPQPPGRAVRGYQRHCLVSRHGSLHRGIDNNSGTIITFSNLSMGTDGIIFILAFTTMVILIVWTIWKVIRDQKSGIIYFNMPSSTPPINEPTGTRPKPTPRLQGIALGASAVIVGVGLLYFENTSTNPLLSSSVSLRTTGSGIILYGFLILYKSLRIS